MKCNLCGKEIDGWGHNPHPLCSLSDMKSRCCENCNNDKVIFARILQHRYQDGNYIVDPKVGEEIVIFWINDEPKVQDYILRNGTIESIDDVGQLHGTWGGLAVDPKNDSFIVCRG